jgi:translation initiation factor IF-1
VPTVHQEVDAAPVIDRHGGQRHAGGHRLVDCLQSRWVQQVIGIGLQVAVDRDQDIVGIAAFESSSLPEIKLERCRIVMGDRVTVVMSPYDLRRGRIVYRLRAPLLFQFFQTLFGIFQFFPQLRDVVLKGLSSFASAWSPSWRPSEPTAPPRPEIRCASCLHAHAESPCSCWHYSSLSRTQSSVKGISGFGWDDSSNCQTCATGNICLCFRWTCHLRLVYTPKICCKPQSESFSDTTFLQIRIVLGEGHRSSFSDCLARHEMRTV